MKHQKMKNQMVRSLTSKNFHTALNLLILTVLITCLSGCGFFNRINNSLDNAVQVLDKATNKLNANAGNFTSIMQEAIDKISDNDIKNQLQDALDNAIVTTSTEVRCDIQFTGDYLKKQLKIIKARLTHSTIPASFPVTCNVTPTSIDMNRPPNNRNQVSITGYFLNENFSAYQLWLYSAGTSGAPGSGLPGAPGASGSNGAPKTGRTLAKTNVTRHLSLSTDFKLIINLGNNGIRLNEKSNKLRLLWNGKLVTEILMIQPVKEPCQLREYTLTDLPKMPLVPKHKAYGSNPKGNKEFSGNGPCVSGSTQIYTKKNGRELWAWSFVQMWECRDNFDNFNYDYTYGSIERNIKLKTVDNGWYIKTIKDATTDNMRYIDESSSRNDNIAGSGPVANYFIIGDTPGDDLGSSRVDITFKPIAVTLEKLSDCIRNPNKKPAPNKVTLSAEPVKLNVEKPNVKPTNIPDKVSKTKPKPLQKKTTGR